VWNVTGGAEGIKNSSHLFILRSVPQVNLQNRSIAVIVGDLLGGSSAVNGMQVHRGQKEDYDRWGAYFGKDSTWSWDALLPYFKKVSCQYIYIYIYISLSFYRSMKYDTC